jgi:hypothetical protein
MQKVLKSHLQRQVNALPSVHIDGFHAAVFHRQRVQVPQRLEDRRKSRKKKKWC